MAYIAARVAARILIIIWFPDSYIFILLEYSFNSNGVTA
jgi:hypothetical protein